MSDIVKALTNALGEPTMRIGRQVGERLENATTEDKIKLCLAILASVSEKSDRVRDAGLLLVLEYADMLEK